MFDTTFKIDSLFDLFKYPEKNTRDLDSIHIERDTPIENIFNNHDSIRVGFKWLKEFHIDSSYIKDFTLLTSKVFVSISHDSLSLKKIDRLLRPELSRKNLNIDYGLTFEGRGLRIQKLNARKPTQLTTNSESPFFT